MHNAYSVGALKMRLFFIVLILGAALVLSGCVQPPEEPEVTEKVASGEWTADGVVSENEYSKTMVLVAPARQGYSGGSMEISWKNDQEYLYMALNGTAQGWVSIGFDPAEWMKNADIVMGSVKPGSVQVLDEYSTGNYGPHLEDTSLGGSDDLLEVGGRQDGENIIIEFKRKLDTGDRFDKVLVPGEAVSIIWASSDSSDLDFKHDVAYGEGILTLSSVNEAVPAASNALTAREVEGILFIREEEKVARDLYQAFYDEFNLTVFSDLARSEQSHMDSIKIAVDKYGLEDPVIEEQGVFTNQTLKQMYEQLLASGKQSEEDALKASATFEEISIIDLEKELNVTKSEDVRLIYEGLLAGSRKHLRSYVRDLQELGVSYVPKHLTLGEFNETVT
jgi:hypothetical protein